jgi:hypothetical protein
MYVPLSFPLDISFRRSDLKKYRAVKVEGMKHSNKSRMCCYNWFFYWNHLTKASFLSYTKFHNVTNLNSLNDLRFQKIPNRLMSISQSKSSDTHAHEFCIISFCASLLGSWQFELLLHSFASTGYDCFGLFTEAEAYRNRSLAALLISLPFNAWIVSSKRISVKLSGFGSLITSDFIVSSIISSTRFLNWKIRSAN